MNKAHRCLLHLGCMAIKLARSQDAQWHWQHLLREFGLGRYANARLLLPRGNCRSTFQSR